MARIADDFKPTPAPDVLGRDLGDEYMFYDTAGDCFHVLNGTAREIFLLCDGDRTVEEIARVMAETYAIDGSQARRDTVRTVEQLVELGVLTA